MNEGLLVKGGIEGCVGMVCGAAEEDDDEAGTEEELVPAALPSSKSTKS